jgi:hypothetical protein
MTVGEFFVRYWEVALEAFSMAPTTLHLETLEVENLGHCVVDADCDTVVDQEAEGNGDDGGGKDDDGKKMNTKILCVQQLQMCRRVAKTIRLDVHLEEGTRKVEVISQEESSLFVVPVHTALSRNVSQRNEMIDNKKRKRMIK